MKLLTTWLTTLIMIFSTAALAGEPPAEQAALPAHSRFVDLDGDGLNDEISDLNQDGIPDFGNDPSLKSLLPDPDEVTDFFKSIDAKYSASEAFLSNSERFGLLRFCTRALSQSRGGFGSSDDFGPGSGIGQRTSAGACAGGVCRQ